ncbi:F0F1 ATP synthase subunit gamma, partial [Candidatus Microgenomates bacterium]|nr:F0F1 ATP synthase subunit gamma [Candidatus Microgenomates bacterium]
YLINLFNTKQTDLVLVAYTKFVNTVTQKAIIFQLLPIIPQEEVVLEKDLLFEPSISEVLNSLLIHYCESSLYTILVENSASEHSARMVAMKNAHENAQDIISELTLFYNKTRQNAITNELADTISGSYA